MPDTDALWADFAKPIATAEDYIASLRGRRMNVFFMGERVPEPADHPVIFPSINAMAETYRLASERPELGGVHTPIADLRTNRFLHVPTGPDDLVAKHEMQRELGRRTGTCFQRWPAWSVYSDCDMWIRIGGIVPRLVGMSSIALTSGCSRWATNCRCNLPSLAGVMSLNARIVLDANPESSIMSNLSKITWSFARTWNSRMFSPSPAILFPYRYCGSTK